MNTILLVSFALLILVISLGEADSHRISRWRPSWLSRVACPKNYCRNDGVCRRKRGSISCKCPCGFSGSRCECKRDECATNNPCQFNSLCLNNVDGPGVTCQCPPGYSGENCEINIDDCVDTPCKNNGTCVDGINSFLCECPENVKTNYIGKFCEVECTVEFERNFESYKFDSNLINEDTQPSNEECNSTCTGNCTGFLFESSTCKLYGAPVLSVTIGVGFSTNICERICLQQPTCLSYVFDSTTLKNCYTFTTTSEELPTAKGPSLSFQDKSIECKPTQ